MSRRTGKGKGEVQVMGKAGQDGLSGFFQNKGVLVSQ